MDKIGPTLAGIALILFGISVILNPTSYGPIYRYLVDYTGYNIPLGVFIIGVGVLLLWTTLKKKKGSE